MTAALSGDASFDDPLDLADAVAALPAPLLVCTDIDGTLSAIASTPAEARLVAGAGEALRALTHAGIEVAVVSGRPMAELVRQFELPRTLRLVGSHGVEFEQSVPRTEHETELLDRVDGILQQIADRHAGAALERKPFGSALHVRRCTDEVGDDALREAHAAIDMIDGVHVLLGHRVYEVVVRQMTKVGALAELRRLIDPAAVVFVGDDQSDELVFASFADLAPDARQRTMSVKVGAGPTVATHRLQTPAHVVTFLARIVALANA